MVFDQLKIEGNIEYSIDKKAVYSLLGYKKEKTKLPQIMFDRVEKAFPRHTPNLSFRASSRSAVLTIGSSHSFRVIRENINPFGRKILNEELEAENLGLVRQYARRQEEAGAHALDVNLGKKGKMRKKKVSLSQERL